MFGQVARNQCLQRWRHTASQIGQRGRLGVVDLMHDGRLLRGIKRRTPGDQVVQHCSQ